MISTSDWITAEDCARTECCTVEEARVGLDYMVRVGVLQRRRDGHVRFLPGKAVPSTSRELGWYPVEECARDQGIPLATAMEAAAQLVANGGLVAIYDESKRDLVFRSGRGK